MVTHIHVARPFGESAVVPWEKIGTFSLKEVTLAADNIAAFTGEPDEKMILLKDYILDKKAIDPVVLDLEKIQGPALCFMICS